MAEVIQISQGKKKGKTPINEVYAQIANTIMGTNGANRQGLGQNFQVYEPAAGIREVITLAEDGVATVVNQEAVVAEILRYGQLMKSAIAEYCLSHSQAAEAMRVWRGLAEPIQKPETLRWLSDPGTCWRRIPFDLVQGESPTWDKLLKKITDEDTRTAVKAWIGSLFVPGSYRQQYVWIYGGGGNGKGCIARFLHRVFGNAAHFVSHVPRDPNQFFTWKFLNKRLAIFPDCENYSFPASGIFKTLSGGDPVEFEKKHGDSHTEILNLMFLFTSNQLPSLSSEKSDMRRAIFARMEDGGAWEADFEEKLWEEGGSFLDHCIGTYAVAAPTCGPIVVKNEELQGWVKTLEEPFEEAFAEYFALDPIADVEPKDMQLAIRAIWDKRGQQIEFLRWMEREHGVRKKGVKVSKSVVYRYAGVKIKRMPVRATVWKSEYTGGG